MRLRLARRSSASGRQQPTRTAAGSPQGSRRSQSKKRWGGVCLVFSLCLWMRLAPPRAMRCYVGALQLPFGEPPQGAMPNVQRGWVPRANR
jgi:hypothetical protein